MTLQGQSQLVKKKLRRKWSVEVHEVELPCLSHGKRALYQLSTTPVAFNGFAFITVIKLIDLCQYTERVVSLIAWFGVEVRGAAIPVPLACKASPLPCLCRWGGWVRNPSVRERVLRQLSGLLYAKGCWVRIRLGAVGGGVFPLLVQNN